MSYLEGYGVREARQEKWLKKVLLAALAVVVLGTAFYFWQRDRSEKVLVRDFLEFLRKGDYKGGYALWGCTDATPCRDYGFDRYMQDWGPASPQAAAASASVTRTKHCETGVAQFVTYPDGHDVVLWVERKGKTLGFSPYAFPRNNVSAPLQMMFDAFGPCKPQ